MFYKVGMVSLAIALGLIFGPSILSVAQTAPSSAVTSEALLQAAAKGDVRSVQMLLDSGVAVNATDRDGVTALMEAAMNNATEVVTFLLDRGADVNARSKFGITAFAWSTRSLTCMTVLLNRGAQVSQEDLNRALMLAIRGHDPARMAFLLDHGGDVDAKNPDGTTTVYYAADSAECLHLLLARGAHCNREELSRALALTGPKAKPDWIAFLLQRGADPNAKDEYDRTVLMEAAREGNAAVVKALLDRGAEVNLRDQRGRVGWTAFRYATQSLACMQLLLARSAHYTRTDLNEMLVGAVELAGPTEVALLLRLGADPNTHNNRISCPVGMTPKQIRNYRGPSVLTMAQERLASAKVYPQYDDPQKRLEIVRLLRESIAHNHSHRAQNLALKAPLVP